MSKRVFSLHDSLFNNNTQLEVQFEPGGLNCEKWKNNHVTGRVLNKDDILRIHKSASCLHSSSRSSVCQEKTQNAVCVKILCRHNPKNRVWIVVLLWWEQVTAVPLYSHTEQKPMHFWYKNYHLPTKQYENNWNVYDKNPPVKNKRQQPCTLVMEHKRRNIEFH